MTDSDAEGAGPPEEADERHRALVALVAVALRFRMHGHRPSTPDDLGHIDTVLGDGDGAITVIDDGADHCIIGRPVGRSADGCVYVLVARVSLYAYEQLRDGEIALEDAFTGGRDIALVGLFEVDGRVENIMVLRHYRRADRVPADYLPPSSFAEFDEAPSDEESPDGR